VLASSKLCRCFDRYKDGVELSNSDKVSITVAGDKFCLTVLSAQQTDGGEYKIVLSAPTGRLSCTATLLVTGRPTHIGLLYKSRPTASSGIKDCRIVQHLQVYGLYNSRPRLLHLQVLRTIE